MERREVQVQGGRLTTWDATSKVSIPSRPTETATAMAGTMLISRVRILRLFIRRGRVSEERQKARSGEKKRDDEHEWRSLPIDEPFRDDLTGESSGDGGALS